MDISELFNKKSHFATRYVGEELVLGRQGVQLGRDLQTLVDRVETASPGGCLQRVCYPTFFGIAEVPAPGARFVADAVPSP